MVAFVWFAMVYYGSCLAGSSNAVLWTSCFWVSLAIGLMIGSNLWPSAVIATIIKSADLSWVLVLIVLRMTCAKGSPWYEFVWDPSGKYRALGFSSFRGPYLVLIPIIEEIKCV